MGNCSVVDIIKAASPEKVVKNISICVTFSMEGSEKA